MQVSLANDAASAVRTSERYRSLVRCSLFTLMLWVLRRRLSHGPIAEKVPDQNWSYKLPELSISDPRARVVHHRLAVCEATTVYVSQRQFHAGGDQSGSMSAWIR